MGIEEFMVGDWAVIKDWPIGEKVGRIEPGHFVRSHCSFEPIPLTMEILKANGFIVSDYNKFLDKDMGGLPTQFTVKCRDGVLYVQDCLVREIKYVHQFQQLMRAIGVKQQINSITNP